MKKRMILAAGAAVLVLAAAAVAMLLLPDSDGDIIEELNQNSHLPTALAMPEVQVPAEGLTYLPGFGGYGLEGDGVSLRIGGWPDVLDSYHVIQVSLSSPGYHVLGLQVGDSAEKAEAVMAQYGYRTAAEENRRICTKGPVTVVLHLEAGWLTRLNVSLATTNKDNVVF